MTTLTLDQVLSGADLGLDWGLSDLLLVELSERTVLYGLSRIDGALIELTVHPSGSTAFDDSLSLSGTFQVGIDPSMAWFEGDILISGRTAEDNQIVETNVDGNLSVLASDGALGTLSSAAEAGAYVIAAGQSSDEINVFQKSGQSFVWIDGLADNASTYLQDVADIETFSIGATQYAAVTSRAEAGVSVLQLDALGNLSVSAQIGTLDGLPIAAPASLEVVEHLGKMHILVASQGSSSLSSMEFLGPDTFQVKDHILDAQDTFISGVATTASVVVNNFAFLAAGGDEAGVSLFTVLPNGEIFHLASFADTENATLLRPSALSISATADSLNLFVGSTWEAGLTRLTYDLSTLGAVMVAGGGTILGTSGDDQIVGSDTADTISGDSGNDIIVDGQGSDLLSGGLGEDTFVFIADGQPDSILDFQPGIDRLDLSRFDFLNDVSQIDVVSTSDGAILSYADEEITIISIDGSGLSFGDFTNANTLNADRPPLLQVNQALNGGEGNDVLNGGAGNDTISGFGGADELAGGAGLDLLIGAEGADTLKGEAGDDIIRGDSGPDLLIGGDGNDYLEGGFDGDLIYGDAIL